MTRGHGNKDTERAPVGNVLYNRPFHQVVTQSWMRSLLSAFGIPQLVR